MSFISKIKQFSPSFLILLPLLVTISCNDEPEASRSTNHFGMMRDSLVKYNREVVRTEDQQIEDFISRYGWKMKQSGTGLRYMIFKNGTGKKAEKGKIAVIRFNVKLLNGNLCYSSDKDGLKEFRIGHGGIESGVEEGILYMRVGDRGKFIVPSHLAFGLLGDQNKIPRRATLVYDIELVKLK